MSHNPFFSIIVPIYNVEKYLEEALESIKNQTYGSFEAILIDDGSTDSSREIAKNYVDNDNRFKLVLQSNKGLSAARNEGLKRIRGVYVVFLDSDDLLHFQMLEKIIFVLTCYPDKEMIQIRCLIKREVASAEDWEKMVLQPIVYNNEQNLDGKSFYIHALQTLNPIFGVWNFVYKKTVFDAMKEHFVVGIVFEDSDFIPRALCHAKTVWVLDEICYIYRIRALSIMTKHSRKSPFDFLRVLSSLAQYFRDFDLAFRKAYAPFLYLKCFRNFQNTPKEYDQELTLFIKSLAEFFPLPPHSREARLVKMVSFFGVRHTIRIVRLRALIRQYLKI